MILVKVVFKKRSLNWMLNRYYFGIFWKSYISVFVGLSYKIAMEIICRVTIQVGLTLHVYIWRTIFLHYLCLWQEIKNLKFQNIGLQILYFIPIYLEKVRAKIGFKHFCVLFIFVIITIKSLIIVCSKLKWYYIISDLL